MISQTLAGFAVGGGSTGVSKLSSGVHIGREFASFSAKLKLIDVKSSVDSSVNSF